MMVPEFVMVEILVTEVVTVTVTPAGINITSVGPGATPPIQVEPSFQLPPAGAAVMKAACAS